jgi:hypothetical protein
VASSAGAERLTSTPSGSMVDAFDVVSEPTPDAFNASNVAATDR